MNGIIHDTMVEGYKTHLCNEISIEALKSKWKGYLDKIVLYGAGSVGIGMLFTLRRHGIEPIAFLDADDNKNGCFLYDIPVFLPEKYRQLTNVLALICLNSDGEQLSLSLRPELLSSGLSGVISKLNTLGCKNTIYYCDLWQCYDLFKDNDFNLPCCFDVKQMLINPQKIQQAYDCLEDELSREFFIKLLRYRLVDKKVQINSLNPEDYHIDFTVLSHNPEEVIVDCGTYKGDYFKRVIKKTSVKEFIGIGPDCYAFESQIKTLSLQGYKNKISTLRYALSDHSGIERWFNIGSGAFLAPEGDSTIEVSTLDILLENKSPTLIKMNVEGSEIKSLQGGESVIRRHKPVLAISGYHKTDDLWEIPLMMKKLNKDYSVYLRSYKKHLSISFYAVPENRKAKNLKT